MNRYSLVVIILLIVVVVSGCAKEGYTYDEAVKRGDIVIQPGVENFDKFERFLHNLSDKKQDTIRITGYTHEGDPIFEDLKYDGKVIQYTHDNTNDEYAGENNKGIEKDICSKITEKEDEAGYIEYRLTGCSKYDKSLIRIEKNKVKQP